MAEFRISLDSIPKGAEQTMIKKKNMINSDMCIDLEKFCLNSFYVDFLPHYLNISYIRSRTNHNYIEQTIKVKWMG